MTHRRLCDGLDIDAPRRRPDRVVGLTGSPGAGKSTLVASLASVACGDGGDDGDGDDDDDDGGDGDGGVAERAAQTLRAYTARLFPNVAATFCTRLFSDGVLRFPFLAQTANKMAGGLPRSARR